jgi:hypothetical protein
MGAYINPKDEDKAQFLQREGKPLKNRGEARAHDDFKTNLLCALVFTPTHTAAAIAFDRRELQDFTDPGDKRPITYYVVPREKIYPVSNLEQYLPEGK